MEKWSSWDSCAVFQLILLQKIKKINLEQALKKAKITHTCLWCKAFFLLADQRFWTQSITEIELYVLTEMKRNLPSQQKKGQEKFIVRTCLKPPSYILTSLRHYSQAELMCCCLLSSDFTQKWIVKEFGRSESSRRYKNCCEYDSSSQLSIPELKIHINTQSALDASAYCY